MTTSDYLRDTRVVVIGAGVVGAALAYRLAQAGAAVTVVERRHAGAGASGATFGWLNGVDKAPKAYHRLNVAGIRDQEDLADEVGGDWIHATGTLLWADPSDAARTAALAQTVRQLAGWGARADRVAAADVTDGLEPDLVLPTGAQAHLVPRSGWMDALAMAHGTLAAARERYGVTLVTGDVQGLPVADGMIDHVDLADGRTVDADLVINAAGPDAGHIAGLAGATLRVERSPGLLLISRPVPARIRHVLWGPGIHLRPDGGGRILVQWEPLDDLARDTDDPDGGLPDLRHAAVHDAMARAAALVPALGDAPPEAIRAGIRAMPFDGYPLVGFDPAIGNLYHCVTHSGITLAARLATLVTEELTGEDPADLVPYRPDRQRAAFGEGGSRE